MRLAATLASVVLATSACQREPKSAQVSAAGGSAKPGQAMGSNAGSGSAARRPSVQQVAPPFDVGKPPADAVKTASGLTYKIITAVPGAPKAGKNDTVQVQYTGWKPNGETFYTTRTRGKPMPMPLHSTAPGFSEALQLLGQGEKAMLWLPPEIGYRAKPQAGAEALAYEVEVIAIDAAPPVPPDVAAPPANATRSPSGIARVTVKLGSGGAKPARWDDVVYHFSSWDTTGRMLESSEMRKRPMTVAPFRQPPGIEEALTGMVVGERSRFWIPGPLARKSQPPAEGVFTFEIEILEIKPKPAPPPTPTDVAAPPADAQKTASGLAYKRLAGSKGKGKQQPGPTQAVKVHYTGWTTDGKLFDSSILNGNPAQFSLNGVIAGWTEGLQLMSVGETFRFWIPEQLAYAGAPGKPQGMLVFDIELLEVNEAPVRPPLPTRPMGPRGMGSAAGGARGGHAGHGHGSGTP